MPEQKIAYTILTEPPSQAEEERLKREQKEQELYQRTRITAEVLLELIWESFTQVSHAKREYCAVRIAFEKKHCGKKPVGMSLVAAAGWMEGILAACAEEPSNLDHPNYRQCALTDADIAQLRGQYLVPLLEMRKDHFEGDARWIVPDALLDRLLADSLRKLRRPKFVRGTTTDPEKTNVYVHMSHHLKSYGMNVDVRRITDWCTDYYNTRDETWKQSARKLFMTKFEKLTWKLYRRAKDAGNTTEAVVFLFLRANAREKDPNFKAAMEHAKRTF